MKSTELIKKYPVQYLIWNLNPETGVFWVNLETLEENGFMDPWNNRISLKGARRERDSGGDILAYHLDVEYQGYPIELIVINE